MIPRGVLAAWGQDEGCVVGLRRGGGPRWLHLSEGHSGGKGSIPGIQMQSLELHPQSRTVPLTPFSRPWGLQQPGCSPRPSISLTTLQFGALCPHGTHSATTPPPQIEKVDLRDEGVYTCAATSLAGESKRDVALKVLGEDKGAGWWVIPRAPPGLPCGFRGGWDFKNSMSLSAFILNFCLSYSFLGSSTSLRAWQTSGLVTFHHTSCRLSQQSWVMGLSPLCPFRKDRSPMPCSCAGSGVGFLPQRT